MARRKTPRRKASRPARKTKAAARKPARKRTKSARRPKAVARKTAQRTRAIRPSRRAKAAKNAKRAKRPAKRPARRAAAKPRKRTQKAARSDTRQTAPREKPVLDRIRRLLAEEERLGAAAAAREGDHMSAAAVSGRGALRAELNRHTESSPTLTAGDVDARWQDAYAVGDEAPGGDNPTPDQDRVDDIGKALGIQYQDGEELKGGEEVLERDRHRWEMDPASSDDWPDKK